jgi:ATP/maltotriose-dependent transcriptional regulator MalT
MLAGLEQSVDQDEERTQASILRAENLFFGLQLVSAAEEALCAAELAVVDAGCRAELPLVRAQLALCRGRGFLATGELPRRTAGMGNDRTAVRAAVVSATAWALQGHFNAAMTAVDARLATARRVSEDLPLAEAWLLNARSLCLTFGGQFLESEKIGAQYQRALDDRRYQVAAALAGAFGYVAVLQGRTKTAQRRLSEALALVRDHGDSVSYGRIAGLLAAAAAISGDLVAAEEALVEAASAGLEGSDFFASTGRAWTAAARGEPSAAAIALDAANAARDAGLVIFETHALHDALRLGARAHELASRMRDVSGPVEGKLAPLLVAHADALVAGHGAALDEIAIALGSLGALLWAAEVSTEAAMCHREAGLPARERAATDRAHAYSARCEGARSPVLAKLGAGESALLTAREREIAGLAGSGLSSRQIAERLVVSVRTVENHLARVYTKLGVNCRSDLVASGL